MTDIILYQGKDDIGTTPAYRISNLENLSWKVSSPVSPMPLPEDSHEENILVKMEGNTADMNISWTIVENTDFGEYDIDNKLFTPTLNETYTVLRTIWLLKDDYVPISIGQGYTIAINDGVDNFISKGTVTEIQFSVSGSSPVVWKATLSFQEGNVVALLDADIPEKPDNVTMSSSGAGSIDLAIKVFNGFSDTPPAFTNISYKHRKTNETSWTEGTLSVGGTFPNITGTISGLSGTYEVKAGLLNGNSAEAQVTYYRDALTSTGTSVITV